MEIEFIKGGNMTEINHVSGLIVDCAYKIHKDLGPGLLESVYRIIMTEKLRKAGLLVEPEKPISFEYDGIHISNGFRLDLLVEKLVIVELNLFRLCQWFTQNNCSPT